MDGNTSPLMGDFTKVPPPTRRRSKGRNSPFPFEDMARQAKTHPGEAILASVNVPEGNIKSLRQYRGDPFEGETGYIRVEMRNSQIIDDERHGDVYLTWVENTTTKK